MAKKSKKNMYYIVAAVVIVVVLIAIFMRGPKEEAPTAPTAPTEPTAPVVPEPTVPTEYVGDKTISNAVCIGREIQATITNIGSESVEIGRSMTIQVNGNAVARPGCEKTTLAAGESIYCDNLAGTLIGLVRPGKQNEIVVKLKASSAQATVTCE